MSRLKRLASAIPDFYHASRWDSYTRLIVKNDGQNWVLSSIASEMQTICIGLDIPVVSDRYIHVSRNQCVFFTSRYELLNKWKKSSHRVAFPYYHGHPDSSDEFRQQLDTIKNKHHEIDRIQVTNSNMEEIVLGTGVARQKVFKIPISIRLEQFRFTNSKIREVARREIGVPQNAAIVGSFQKDGIGFGLGEIPKLIKGPDIFLDTLKILQNEVDNLYVLLTGPARGYVINGLEKMRIPYRHYNLTNYSDIGKYYNALDLYLVTSRDEGGPRAILESMASGIPLVTTRVGQATDLVLHGKNGWIVDVGAVSELAHWAKYALDSNNSITPVLGDAYKTAVDNCYPAQMYKWGQFMTGFVSESEI